MGNRFIATEVNVKDEREKLKAELKKEILQEVLEVLMPSYKMPDSKTEVKFDKPEQPKAQHLPITGIYGDSNVYPSIIDLKKKFEKMPIEIYSMDLINSLPSIDNLVFFVPIITVRASLDLFVSKLLNFHQSRPELKGKSYHILWLHDYKNPNILNSFSKKDLFPNAIEENFLCFPLIGDIYLAPEYKLVKQMKVSEELIIENEKRIVEFLHVEMGKLRKA